MISVLFFALLILLAVYVYGEYVKYMNHKFEKKETMTDNQFKYPYQSYEQSSSSVGKYYTNGQDLFNYLTNEDSVLLNRPLWAQPGFLNSVT